ncbi:MAG: hypothetical protein O7E51_08785 [Acidobacteria bacterium]|nr:hypothetical protein [Acidobacteriota bacterium]
MEQKNMKTPEQIGTLVRKAFPGESGAFRPCAWFDERLDCIRVVARDCSVLETRLSDRLTILEDNYYPEPGRTKVVGFTLKGARHFCNENGLSLSTSIKMSALLDAILANFPEEVIKVCVDFIFRPLVVDKEIEQVDIPDTELQAAY